MTQLLTAAFLAIFFSSNALAWEYVHPNDGYKECMYAKLREYGKKEYLSKANPDHRSHVIATAHQYCK